jgi:hypothetical protein
MEPFLFPAEKVPIGKNMPKVGGHFIRSKCRTLQPVKVLQ